MMKFSQIMVKMKDGDRVKTIQNQNAFVRKKNEKVKMMTNLSKMMIESNNIVDFYIHTWNTVRLCNYVHQ